MTPNACAVQHGHENGKVVVKTGFHVSLTADNPTGRGRAHGYYRHCVRLEVKEWLDTVVGKTAPQHLWELEDQGDWLHTGTTQSGFSKRGVCMNTVHFWFRDRKMAMLFKLTWAGRL
jgi:hypothetical protein